MQGKVDPADLVQEVFLEAHRQIRNFRGTTEAELLAWLRRILAGQIALMLRRYLGTKGRDVTLERDLVGQLDESSQAMGRAWPPTAARPASTWPSGSRPCCSPRRWASCPTATAR